jgi:hypothetical protein
MFLVLFPAGGPFLPSLSVNTYHVTYIIHCDKKGRRKSNAAQAPAQGHSMQNHMKLARSQCQAQSEAKPRTPDPQTKRGNTNPVLHKQAEHRAGSTQPPTTGRNHHSPGPGLPPHQGPTRGRRGNGQARVTQGGVDVTKGNPKLSKSSRDERGAGQTRPASLHRRGKDPSSDTARAPSRPKDSTNKSAEGWAEETWQ